jgi:pimeloyl-ACP methyl ester carboxylesterase
MRSRKFLCALSAGLCAGALAAPGAEAQIAYSPCPDLAGYDCGALSVPLDRSGTVGGTVTLAIRRVVSSNNPDHVALLALAGGPGQAAIPLARDFAAALGAGITTRDLLVFDQRGTGASSPLHCPALDSPSGRPDLVAARCAAELGPQRAFFTTPQSVADIEDIRRESGYDKLAIYGVSYGTKVALAYAAAYPEHVQALILDSVVPPDGPDPFHRSTFVASRRVLRDLCADADCRGISTSPVADLTALVRRLASAPLRGRVVSSGGRPLRVALNRTELLDVLLAGDLNPTLRAELPGSLRSAERGDATPLLRLGVRAEGLSGGQAIPPVEHDSDSVFITTRCEETAFPWNRADPPAARARSATAAAQVLPASAVRPFDRHTALVGELIPLCVGWPVASPPPPPPGPLPAVPTLVLEGAADVRTPVEDAQRVAATIPGAQVVAVPHTGHSVLGSDITSCGRDAVAAFFAGQPVAPCAAAPNPFFPTPLAPTRLSRVRGASRATKTLNALRMTLDDARREFIGGAIAVGHDPLPGERTGGLRAGFAVWTATGIRLTHMAYVPGVVVSGFLPRTRTGVAHFTVTGASAAHGSVRITAHGHVTGRLGGKRIAIAHLAGLARRSPTRRWPDAAFGPAPRLARTP